HLRHAYQRGEPDRIDIYGVRCAGDAVHRAALHAAVELSFGLRVSEPIDAESLYARLAPLANPQKAAFLQRYFKTGPGEYGEGDRFLGITVPQLRRLARELKTAPLVALQSLLASPVHEARLLALLILVQQFERGDAKARQRIFKL